ncbi:hypothetical protein HMPREF0634_1132 [Peptostreptococcus stomatis DSM 17678]|uniref:Uncharacterized protein n=1 Tax=Peptostreptococcus stomatis DSM 17678 TaxID=596315 RepID=E0E2Z3_9FIRM|nr:hypothetical protein [Peptostreptococcus stomatis]EFM64736.1 hypothetical protein HMPREF0634_1132 [Peptostreptococcus stomatis DSM 17678]
METIANYLLSALILSLEILFVLSLLASIFSFLGKKNTFYIYNCFGMNGLVITGLIGTVVHEFSHMLFCLIFRHEIVEFSLFRPYKSRFDGVMGYVNHSCDRSSPYQMVGNFFIGIAPIIVGTGCMILFMRILLPEEFKATYQTFNQNMAYMSNINSIGDSLNIYINIVIAIIHNLNPFIRHSWPRYIVFIYIMYSITSHMDLSKEDIINSRAGLLVFIILTYLINLIFIVLGIKYQILLLKVLISVFSFLTVGLFFAFTTMLISKTLDIFIG